MKSAEILSVLNQKGGVGKTATAIHVGVALAGKGKKVLLVDTDPQGDLTKSTGTTEPDSLEKTLTDILLAVIEGREIDTEDIVIHNDEGVDIIPANLSLSSMELTLNTVMSRETVLLRALKAFEKQYDYIIIDCSPSLSVLPINALAAADGVIVPVQAQYLSTKALEQLIKTIFQIKSSGINSRLQVKGILITMFEKNTNMSKMAEEHIRRYYSQFNVFETKIPKSIKAADASAAGMSLFKFDKNSKIAQAYLDMVDEITG